MKISSENFVDVALEVDKSRNCDDIQDTETFHDPLHGVGNENQEKFYRLNCTVFAEPINLVYHLEESSELGKSENNSTEVNKEVSFMDNVIVKKTVGRRNKKYHIDIQDPSNPTCTQPNCNRTFSSTTLLKAHIRKVHYADRNKFICEQCGAGFTARYLLRRHSTVHGTTRVECHVCHKMLSERTNLSVHLRSHSNTRSHECQICHKKFIRKATLNIHMKFVHRDGDLKCDRCSERFTTRKQWSSHNSRHK